MIAIASLPFIGANLRHISKYRVPWTGWSGFADYDSIVKSNVPAFDTPLTCRATRILKHGLREFYSHRRTCGSCPFTDLNDIKSFCFTLWIDFWNPVLVLQSCEKVKYFRSFLRNVGNGEISEIGREAFRRCCMKCCVSQPSVIILRQITYRTIFCSLQVDRCKKRTF